MVMWLKLLPGGHRVWVRSGEIDFRRPGREPLYARFLITADNQQSVSVALDEHGSHQRAEEIPLTTAGGETCAVVRQALHFRRR